MDAYLLVDLVVVAVLLYCAVKGASRGLVSQLAWVIALLLCFKFSGVFAPAIEPMIAVDPPLKQWIAMLVIYVGLCGVTFVAAGMLSSWMEKAKIIDFDRHLGAILGFVKGVVICMSVMYFLITMSPSLRSIVGKTRSGLVAAMILNNSQFLMKLVPEHALPTVQHVIDQYRQHLQQGHDDLNGATPSSPDQFGTDDGSGFYGSDGFDLSSFVRKPVTNSPGKTPAANPEPTLEDILSSLPGTLRDELTQKALSTLEQATADQKRRLVDQLNQSVPEDAQSILVDFFRKPDSSESTGGTSGRSSSPSGTSSGRTGTSSDSVAGGSSRATTSGQGSSGASGSRTTTIRPGSPEYALLNEIAGIYSQDPEETARITDRARQFLAGVPGGVTRQVLEDWHADVMGLNRDPDPGTNVETRLDDRIVRQLTKAGVTLESLERELRTRLSQR